MKKLLLIFLILIFCTYLSGQDESNFFVYNTEIHEFPPDEDSPCKVVVFSNRKGVLFYNELKQYIKWVSINDKKYVLFFITTKQEEEDRTIFNVLDEEDYLHEIIYEQDAVFIREWFTQQQTILYYE